MHRLLTDRQAVRSRRCAGRRWPVARAATLPVPCAGSVCTSGNVSAAPGFVSAGQATARQSGPTLTVNQTTSNATLNWQSFNISADGTVQFVQPSATPSRSTRSTTPSPSQIFGTLTANGRVFLHQPERHHLRRRRAGECRRPAGIDAESSTRTAASERAHGARLAAAQPPFPGRSPAARTGGDQRSATARTLQTSQGGQILLFAPQITNQGTHQHPRAARRCWRPAAPSTLPAAVIRTLRGLLVEVGGTGGTVTNGDAATVASRTAGAARWPDHGHRWQRHAGRAGSQPAGPDLCHDEHQRERVDQVCRPVTTAASRPPASPASAARRRMAAAAQLVLGANSVTAVRLDTADPSTTVDSVAQPKSDVQSARATASRCFPARWRRPPAGPSK